MKMNQRNVESTTNRNDNEFSDFNVIIELDASALSQVAGGIVLEGVAGESKAVHYKMD